MVEIGCPRAVHDTECEPPFHAIVSAVIHCGHSVQFAFAAEETGTARIDWTYRLIEQCCFGIHDISRIERDPISAWP